AANSGSDTRAVIATITSDCRIDRAIEETSGSSDSGGASPSSSSTASAIRSYSGEPSARVSPVKPTTISSTVPATSTAPAATRTVVRQPSAQPSANGVIQAARSSMLATSATSTATNSSEVNSGGIAPRKNSL